MPPILDKRCNSTIISIYTSIISVMRQKASTTKELNHGKISSNQIEARENFGKRKRLFGSIK